MSPDRSPSTNAPISRRTALRAGAAASAAGVGMTVAAAGPVRAAQDATPAGMQSEHLEVVFTPADPVTITLAGGGPPQRGDYFYVDGSIYAVDDVNGTQIGMYHCFGAWTAAADDTDAPYLRLTTVQFLMDEGSIMGLINELGPDDGARNVGAVQGGTGRYTGALGTFQQLPGPSAAEGTMATPGPGTPAAGQNVVRAVFELMLPQVS
jgi:hypothetical protein